jgi:hypothetical protein
LCFIRTFRHFYILHLHLSAIPSDLIYHLHCISRTTDRRYNTRTLHFMLHSSLSLLDDDFPHTTSASAVPLLSLHLFIGISRHRIPILCRRPATKGISLYIILDKQYALVKSTQLFISGSCVPIVGLFKLIIKQFLWASIVQSCRFDVGAGRGELLVTATAIIFHANQQGGTLLRTLSNGYDCRG